MGKLIEDERKKHDVGLCEMMLNVQKNAQRTKLEAAREHGRIGWETVDTDLIEKMLVKAHEDADWISVANYAGMLYCHSMPSTEGALPRAGSTPGGYRSKAREAGKRGF